ncbi:MAG: zinc metallopeptidase [Anaerolineaceae bacterium]|nr:zinc metallopeptidase [Anaerolineaceae bacterium]
MIFSPLYFIFALPALLLGLWAQFKVKSAFSKYSRVRSMVGLSGAEVARRMLDMNGLYNVRVEMVNGFLSDHYDPTSRTLRLSPDVYRGNSLAAAGIAAHESGHALQHQDAYLPLQIRSAIVPTVQIGSWLGPIIFVIGMFINTQLAWIGLILFAATALFSIVTLPVEFNASRRAKAWLSDGGILNPNEMNGVNSVLDAAALTYVAAAVQAISTVLYYMFLLSGRSRD